MEIANKLVELRKTNNLSQEALAEKLGISRQTVSEWEQAQITPDAGQLAALARLYQISEDDLLRGSGEGENDSFFKQLDPLLWLAAVVAYVVLGCLYHLWHPGWLIFLAVPVLSSAILAVRKKRADCFSYPALVLLVFLYVGCVKMVWHPTWLLFLTIPLYNMITGFFGGKSTQS